MLNHAHAFYSHAFVVLRKYVILTSMKDLHDHFTASTLIM
jgi:hypothetical protein